ncbi:DUF2269 family protein [Bacillus sp. 31A1R]|uniref:DUF2269 family protein n=1 Tax=Robertmurraya mangrovi TaxID=3098077 RepID=A0ABU5J254_9BACI|nr:DUF2269 family protein [Bacillus sp. 31A1R]MDZ5473495.1 DUF2269 family protein [Bacillus sp. 31A1R]
MSLYGSIVLIHIIAAVVGLGASFAMPLVLKGAKTASEARYSLDLNMKIEKFAKIGSIALLLTGLILGFLNTNLFTTGWYITSLVIYVAVQPIVAAIMPKKIKAVTEMMNEHKGEELPESYQKMNLELRPYNMVLHTSVVVLIILMSIKPF